MLVVACRLNCGVWAKLLHSVWDLSSQTRDQTHIAWIARQILNQRTTREVPDTVFLDDYISKGFPGGASDKEPACQCRIHKRCRDASQVHEKDIPGLYTRQQAGKRRLKEFKLLKLNC